MSNNRFEESINNSLWFSPHFVWSRPMQMSWHVLLCFWGLIKLILILVYHHHIFLSVLITSYSLLSPTISRINEIKHIFLDFLIRYPRATKYELFVIFWFSWFMWDKQILHLSELIVTESATQRDLYRSTKYRRFLQLQIITCDHL